MMSSVRPSVTLYIMAQLALKVSVQG